MPHSYELGGHGYLGIAANKPEFVSQISRELIKPGEIMSGMPEPNTVSSFPYNLSMPQHPRLIMDDNGNKYAMEKTSARRYVIPYSEYVKLGPATQFDDLGFLSWDATGKLPQVREEVRIPLKSVNYGLIESFGERQLKVDGGSTKVDLFVHDTWYSGPINQFGKFSHLERNLKQHLMEYYGLKSSQELSSFLKSRGLSMKEIGYLASGLMPEGAAYSVRKALDGKAILSSGEGSFEAMARMARALGLEPKDLVAFGLDEEQIHIARDKDVYTLADLISEEIATKSIARDFYIKMARASQGNPELARKYAILAALKEEDIRTTRKVYTEIHRKHREDLEEIVDKSEQHTATADGKYTAQSGKAGNVVSMPKYKSRGKNSGEKSEVVYARDRFGKNYKVRSAETEGETAESDSRSDRGNPDAKDSGEGKGEAEGGDTAEAA